MPHSHFLFTIPFIIIIALLFFPQLGVMDIVKWSVVGGIVSVLVDLDASIVMNVKPQLKKFRNYVYCTKNYNLFMSTLAKTNMLKVLLMTHILLSILIVLLSYLLFPVYLVPAIIGVSTHLLSDLPGLKLLF